MRRYLGATPSSRSWKNTAAQVDWAAALPRLLGFGTDDTFMHEVGSQDYARHKFGLTAENIAEKVSARLVQIRAA